MNASQTISSLVRALRPAIRPSQPPRALGRPPSGRNLIWRLQPKSFRASFTTSPIAVPPQSDTSTDSSTSPPSSAGERNHTQYSPPSAQPPRPSEKARKQPSYQLTFTCKPCKHRSAHEMSKQGYHRGTVLITCPECRNRHVISDHLKVQFSYSYSVTPRGMPRKSWGRRYGVLANSFLR